MPTSLSPGQGGQRPLKNRTIGSTDRDLARTTVVPALLNRIGRATADLVVVREQRFQRIPVATNVSENADRVFDARTSVRHAIEEATLGHVRSPNDGGVDADVSPQERLAEQAQTLEN